MAEASQVPRVSGVSHDISGVSHDVSGIPHVACLGAGRGWAGWLCEDSSGDARRANVASEYIAFNPVAHVSWHLAASRRVRPASGVGGAGHSRGESALTRRKPVLFSVISTAWSMAVVLVPTPVAGVAERACGSFVLVTAALGSGTQGPVLTAHPAGVVTAASVLPVRAEQGHSVWDGAVMISKCNSAHSMLISIIAAPEVHSEAPVVAGVAITAWTPAKGPFCTIVRLARHIRNVLAV